MGLINCATTIGKYLLTQLGWPSLKPHVDYWWHFDGNIQQLRDGIRELEWVTIDITQRIEVTRHRAEILRPGVEDWANRGTSKLEAARIILPDDNIPTPKAWNLISRYSMGKSATKRTEEIAQHLREGKFDQISDSAPPLAMGYISRRLIMDFESRKRIEEEIMKSLRNSNIRTIAICGMGGVGKTSMVEKISQRVREEDLFDEVAMVVVSQHVEMLKIQKEIAEWFGLTFNTESMYCRAQQLRTRLMDKKRKLIIFDDVWESLKFVDLGIPFESCKILLTSRSTGICKGIRNTKVYEMRILEKGEAWNLFKENAGNCIEDPNLHPLAEKVVAECKGLPIALVTVGKALENEKSERKWEFAISQLNNPTDFQEVVRDVYNPLKLSYDFLKNENEKFLFLLCCLFPEDYNISVEELAWYIMGLGKFGGIDSIKEARNRTHVLVENLKKRSLLIDGSNELSVKMHDVVRDVAIYIGSKEEEICLKSLKNPSKENSSDDNCRWMSVDISNKPMEFPVGRLSPNLRLLMLLKSGNEEFSNISFEGMADLNVLSFSSTLISSLPPKLTNLHTLSLINCAVEEISIIGELTSLKILNFDGCPDITELPEKIRELTCLRLLRLHNCKRLRTIAFGVISRLVQLEELKIVDCFRGWDANQTENGRRNASLGELEYLRNLTCLEIAIDDWNLAFEDINLSQNLVKCRKTTATYEYCCHEEVMNLNFPENIGVVGNWIQMLVKNTEYLCLEGDGSNNFNIAELENLRRLIFFDCSTMEELSNDGRNLNQDVSLRNLESIEITGCSNLRFLFSVSVARTSFLQLQVLKIQSCDKLEQVFWNEIRDDTDACIEFPKLKELKLDNLPNLKAFCHGLENIIKFPNLTKMSIGDLPKLKSLSSLNSKLNRHDVSTSVHFLFNEKVEFGNLKYLSLGGLDNNIRSIWYRQISIDFFNNLEELRIFNLNGIRSLMSYSIAKNLVSLKFLEICLCEKIVEVIEGDDKQVVDIFPTLKRLVIMSLPKLIRFWKWNGALKLPLLEDVEITNCSVMNNFTMGSLLTPNIRRIFIETTELQNEKDLNIGIQNYRKRKT